MNREELLKILIAVRPGLAQKEIIEQSTSFIIQNKTIYTYNDEVSISHPVDLDIEGAVQAEALFNLLNKSKGIEVELETVGKELRITGTKYKCGLRMDEEMKLPLDEMPKPRRKDWIDLPKDFKEALKFCHFSAGTDMTKPVLTNIYIKKDFAISCDNFRLTEYKFPKRTDLLALLIPARIIPQLINYDIVQVAPVKGWIYFRTPENVMFSCRVFNEVYPDLSSFKRVRGEDIGFPTEMIEALERAEVIADKEITKERIIEIEMERGKLIIKSKGKVGWFEESYRNRYKGGGVRFNINTVFLKEIIKHLRTCVIDKDCTRLKFTGDNFIHVMSLEKI